MNRKILGESKSVRSLLSLIRQVAASKTNILIVGESGTGKELVARMIHDSGPLKNQAFVPINCGAIPENLIESEMFGHKKGSFTGAVQDKIGLFQAANGGTLFLDEVGELPVGLQVKLLRAIQERVFRKVGGTEDIRVDVRIIAATNRNLEEAVVQGTFREDLYYRLNVILIRVPPLREREGDVPILIRHFLNHFSSKMDKSVEGIEDDALSALVSYRWPGNVRELENVVHRAVTLETGKKIGLESLPPSVGAWVGSQKSMKSQHPGFGANEDGIRIPAPDFSKGSVELDRILGEVERMYMVKALEHVGGVKKKAADLLGITFRSIRYRLKKLGVEAGEGDSE